MKGYPTNVRRYLRVIRFAVNPRTGNADGSVRIARAYREQITKLVDDACAELEMSPLQRWLHGVAVGAGIAFVVVALVYGLLIA